MTSKQRAYLKGLASNMEPIVHVGKASASAEVVTSVQEALEAFYYQIGKEIAAMSVAMKGEVDQIIFTGGIAHSQIVTDAISELVDWIAPVTVYPGEDEMQALAEGAWRVLTGEEEAKKY